MALPAALQSRIERLDQRLAKFLERSTLAVAEDEKENFLEILRDTCSFVREETSKQSPNLEEVVESARRILNKAVQDGYWGSDMFDFMPSWAHDNAANQPLIEDNTGVEQYLPMSGVLRWVQLFNVPKGSKEWDSQVPSAWSDNMKRHPKSSPLARPRPNLPALTPTVANPVAMSVYDARCEIRSERVCQPTKLRLSQGGACLALNGPGGFKGRSPALCYYLLDEPETDTGLQEHHYIEPGLVDVAYQMAVDESRHLVFVADYDRVKSYAWKAPNGENYKRKPHPTHTLNCGRTKGPIAVLPNGTVIRAGKGQILVWDIDSLETHGEDGKGVVGKLQEDLWETTDRDDPENLETSTGSTATSRIKFAGHPDLTLAGWDLLPQTPATMLCHPDNHECFTIDLEHGGAVNTYYLGHGGRVNDFSLSEGDPQVFLTACSDGFARLFDRRAPLPALTFDVFDHGDFYAIALAHPDGIPSGCFLLTSRLALLTISLLEAVFTGTGRAEQIKMWDVRARTSVYELATGNNRSNSLAWDPNRNCLYAATECSYQDRVGYRHEYRLSRKWKDQDLDKDDMESDVAWPEKAWHDEYYYGYAFDAGEHRIFRYAFKENPDPSIMPEYGDASINESRC
ncbi:hypothetical protein FRC12_001084 [Ceratobasidium sp. 428]|nr:hypothetical protein FRC09_013033 [Ceratobasidium sp. 395]KAG8776124.1 hypothetical protein FRC12_001084 [Ceratobasidium sp. 428]